MAPRDYQGMSHGQMVWTVPPISMFFLQQLQEIMTGIAHFQRQANPSLQLN